MEKQESFIQAVVSKAKKNTWEFLGKTPQTFLFGIVSIVVVAIAKGLFGISAMNSKIIEVIVDIVVGSFLFLVVAFVVNLINSPRLLYYEQQKEITKMLMTISCAVTVKAQQVRVRGKDFSSA